MVCGDKGQRRAGAGDKCQQREARRLPDAVRGRAGRASGGWQSWSRFEGMSPIVLAVNTKATTRRLVRVQQAADLLGVSASTVRRWAADGRIPCQRTPSGQRRFLPDDLERALRKGDLPSRGRASAGTSAERRYRLLF